MPIRRELRDLYPAHWRELSRRVRFERAHGMCQGCGRPHGATVRCLPDGRWYDPAGNTWRDRRGRSARWPDLEQIVRLRTTRVVLAAAHLDHDPANNRLRNLRGLCQRCHLIHDRPHHLADHLSAPPRLGGLVPGAVRPFDCRRKPRRAGIALSVSVFGAGWRRPPSLTGCQGRGR